VRILNKGDGTIKEHLAMIPYVRNDQEIFFKTIIPSRKMKKMYKDEQ